MSTVLQSRPKSTPQSINNTTHDDRSITYKVAPLNVNPTIPRHTPSYQYVSCTQCISSASSHIYVKITNFQPTGKHSSTTSRKTCRPFRTRLKREFTHQKSRAVSALEPFGPVCPMTSVTGALAESVWTTITSLTYTLQDLPRDDLQTNQCRPASRPLHLFAICQPHLR
jgi:hypothetical protein